MDWELGERVPNVAADFDVWLTDGTVRRVRHVETFMGAALHFMDCQHPLSNVYCPTARVQGWRLASAPASAR